MNGSAGMLIGLFAGMAAGLWLPANAVSAIEPAGLLWFNALRKLVGLRHAVDQKKAEDEEAERAAMAAQAAKE